MADRSRNRLNPVREPRPDGRTSSDAFAETTLCLASDAGSYVTGTEPTVDGSTSI